MPIAKWIDPKTKQLKGYYYDCENKECKAKVFVNILQKKELFPSAYNKLVFFFL